MAEELFVDKHQLEGAVKALLQVVEKKKKKDFSSALEPEIINMQLGFKKIPNLRNKIIKIPVPNSVVSDTTDICMFVRDEDKTDRDYAPTVRHFKDLLASKGIKRHIEIIPLKSVKLEYQPYEAKRNLSNMYDMFLADDRIARLLPRLLGKHFLARKKYPVQVNLQAEDLKKEIEKTLNQQQCIVGGKGSTSQVTVAHSGMTHTAIINNVEATIETLARTIPGGAKNIRSLHLKTISSPALPIYASLGNIEEVSIPARKKTINNLEAEDATTVPDTLVKVTKLGRLKLISRSWTDDAKTTAEDPEDPDAGSDGDGEEEKEPRQPSPQKKRKREPSQVTKVKKPKADLDTKDKQKVKKLPLQTSGKQEKISGSVPVTVNAKGKSKLSRQTVKKPSSKRKRSM